MMHTLRRLMAALAAVFLVGLFAPAQATNTTNNPTWATATNCQPFSSSNLTGGASFDVCAYATWHRQADDTGIVVEDLRVWMPHGCSVTEQQQDPGSNLGVYNPATWVLDYPNGQALTSGSWGKIDYCSFDKTLDVRGTDTGYMMFGTAMHVRINTFPDKMLDMGWNLNPDGNSSLVYSFATDCPCS